MIIPSFKLPLNLCMRNKLLLIFIWFQTIALGQQLKTLAISQTGITLQATELSVGDILQIKDKMTFIVDQDSVDNQSYTFRVDDLAPSELIELNWKNGSNPILTKYFITQSSSSGEITHYFNHPLANSTNIAPSGTSYTEVQQALRNLIRSAKHSIDYCAYNTNETFIVNELIDAHNRGVNVRVITEEDTGNTAFNFNTPFPVFKDQYEGLMHNKFIVVDEVDADVALVVTGSMNFTSNQMRTDPNHLIFIQDQSLAKTYTTEFNEMWGSEGTLPNRTLARFGDQKLDNTPHEFVINNVPVELYFSPSDGTTGKIGNAIAQSTSTVDIGLLLFTSWELRDEVLDASERGIKLRVLLEDKDNSEAVERALAGAGIPVFYHEEAGQFHYKMCILDAGTENGILVTGSHNWTFSAETINNENTLIIHDPDIAAMYESAFRYWWKNYSTFTNEAQLPDLVLSPNPASEYITLSDVSGSLFHGQLEIYNSEGHHVFIRNYSHIPHFQIDISHLPPGLYALKLYDNRSSRALQFVKL